MQTTIDHLAGNRACLGPERRASQRRRALKGARLIFNGGHSTFECVARNLSERGAKLVLGDVSGVPACFELEISNEAAARTAHIQWRTSDAIGVSWIAE